MSVWKTTVAGLTWTDIYKAGKAAVDDFFGSPPPMEIAIGWWITGHPIETSTHSVGSIMTQTHYTAEVEVRW
jgi:hypothetical protein